MISHKGKEILKKTSKLSFFILLNKPIGFIRDILHTRYFGLGYLADAYTVAWRIPNIFRRIFGEGLLSSTLLPDLVKIEKNEKKEILEEVLTVITFIMQIVITIICFIISYYSTSIITFLSPGALERIVHAGSMLKILSFFTFFMTFSAILGTAVQLKKNFYIGSQSQFILNIFLCIEYFYAQKYNLSYSKIMWLITGNGFLILFIHFIVFYYYGFQFKFPSQKSIKYSLSFLNKFFVALTSAILLEGNTFINISISSYLIPGMLSLIELLHTLIRLPLQIIGSSIGTTSNLDIIKCIQNNDFNEMKYIGSSIAQIFFIISCLTTGAIYFFGDYFFIIFFYLTNLLKVKVTEVSFLFFLLSFALFPALANKIINNIFYAKEKIFITVIVYLGVNILQNIILTFFVIKYQSIAVIGIYVFIEWVRFFILYYYVTRVFKIPLHNKINFHEIIKKLIFIIGAIILMAGMRYALLLLS